MWRDGARMAAAAENLAKWRRYVLTKQLTNPAGWEVQNLLTVASMMLRSALERTESRGVHLRTDFPETDDAGWRRRLVIQRGS